MENKEAPKPSKMPGVLSALGEGCDLTANRPQLLIMPILLDLFLLFGPRLSIYRQIEKPVKALFAHLYTANPAALAGQFESSSHMFLELLEQVNLLGALKTFPIGLPSLLAESTPLVSPLGNAEIIDISSGLGMIGLVLLFSLIGFFLGCVYYGIVGRATVKEQMKGSFGILFKQMINVLCYYLVMLLIIVVLLIPFGCSAVLMAGTAPTLLRFFIVLPLAAALWITIPLFYVPHGIFVRKLRFRDALKRSLELARWSLGSTGFFFIVFIVISFGMDMIWSIPNADSWLILISVFGHAFVSTAMLAGSFILYQHNLEWQEKNRDYLEWRKNYYLARRKQRTAQRMSQRKQADDALQNDLNNEKTNETDAEADYAETNDSEQDKEL